MLTCFERKEQDWFLCDNITNSQNFETLQDLADLSCHLYCSHLLISISSGVGMWQQPMSNIKYHAFKEKKYWSFVAALDTEGIFMIRHTSLTPILSCHFFSTWFSTYKYQRRKNCAVLKLSPLPQQSQYHGGRWFVLAPTWSDRCAACANRFLTSWAIGWAYYFSKNNCQQFRNCSFVWCY